MIAIPTTEQERISRELRQDAVIKMARKLEEDVLQMTDNDFKMAIHTLAIMVAETRIK